MTDKDTYDSGELFSGDEEKKGIEWDGSPINIEKRPRGILSNTDREYLGGLRDYAHAQSEANRKQSIRERIVHSFQDFLLLWLLLEDEEREKVFQELADTGHTDELLGSMITFVYLGLNQDTDRFEKIIENGVYFGANFDKAGRWGGRATNVDATIDIEYEPDIEGLQRQLDKGEGDQLTPAEIGVLARAGKLDSDDLSKLKHNRPTLSDIYHEYRSSGSNPESDDDLDQ